jgi:hypothetical protein
MLLYTTLGMVLASASGQGLQKPAVPEALKAPASESLVLVAHAKGVQIYACVEKPEHEYHWELKGPKAELFDGAGASIGKHYAEAAGPAWEHKDGSKVTGKRVAAQSAPGAIPWLLLSAESTGKGVLSGVKSIQRLNTKGGEAPGGCDAAHVGSQTEVEYTADYYFYAPPK